MYILDKDDLYDRIVYVLENLEEDDVDNTEALARYLADEMYVYFRDCVLGEDDGEDAQEDGSWDPPVWDDEEGPPSRR